VLGVEDGELGKARECGSEVGRVAGGFRHGGPGLVLRGELPEAWRASHRVWHQAYQTADRHCAQLKAANAKLKKQQQASPQDLDKQLEARMQKERHDLVERVRLQVRSGLGAG